MTVTEFLFRNLFHGFTFDCEYNYEFNEMMLDLPRTMEDCMVFTFDEVPTCEIIKNTMMNSHYKSCVIIKCDPCGDCGECNVDDGDILTSKTVVILWGESEESIISSFVLSVKTAWDIFLVNRE